MNFGEFGLFCDIDNIYFMLGTYSSKEKAIKVLDMIQEHIEAPIYTNVRAVEYDHYDRAVFQMPKDDEVITDG